MFTYSANGERVKNFEDVELYPTQVADMMLLTHDMIEGCDNRTLRTYEYGVLY